jgi:hypothetical protein
MLSFSLLRKSEKEGLGKSLGASGKGFGGFGS